jgi:transposase
LVAEGGVSDTLMIDATHLKAHRAAASLLKKGMYPPYRADKRRLNSKLHAICDSNGRPVMMALTEGQMSDHTGARLLYQHLPPAKPLSGDKGAPAFGFDPEDSNAFRQALKAKKIKACIPPRSNRKVQYAFSKTMYK